MVEPILAWTGLIVLLVLCLPFTGSNKLVLEVYSWTLRLALLALLCGAALLWFRPELLPAEVVRVIDAVPGAREILPAPEAPTFGLALAALAAVVLLTLLAILDVTRKLTGGRILQPVETVQEPAGALAAVRTPLARPGQVMPPYPRRDRQSAAETMAEIGSRRSFRVSDDLS